MKTLFIGAYGFGNLGDEMCLIEAIKSFPSSEVYIRSVCPIWTSKFIKCNGFIKWNAIFKSKIIMEFDRIVLGGGGCLIKYIKIILNT